MSCYNYMQTPYLDTMRCKHLETESLFGNQKIPRNNFQIKKVMLNTIVNLKKFWHILKTTSILFKNPPKSSLNHLQSHPLARTSKLSPHPPTYRKKNCFPIQLHLIMKMLWETYPSHLTIERKLQIFLILTGILVSLSDFGMFSTRSYTTQMLRTPKNLKCCGISWIGIVKTSLLAEIQNDIMKSISTSRNITQTRYVSKNTRWKESEN